MSGSFRSHSISMLRTEMNGLIDEALILPLITQVSEQGLALKECKCQAPQECALGTYIAVLGHVLSKLEFICITNFLLGFFWHCLT